LGLKTDGTVVAWGYNLDGQTNVPQGLNDVVAVSAGGFHSMALKSDGSVVTWGSDSNGQCNVPPAAQEGIRLISAGILHSLAVAQGDDYPAISSSPFILGLPNVELNHTVTVAHAVPAPEGGFSAIGLPPGLSLDPITGVISGVSSAARSSVLIRVETDQGMLTQNAWIGISEGLAPTSISLSPAAVWENSAEGVVVGTLSAEDPDEGDTHTFEWVDGEGSADNSWFRIEGDQLVMATQLSRDFEQDPSAFTIRIRARDASLNPVEQIISIGFIDDRTEDVDGDGLTEEEEEMHFTSDTTYDSDGDGFGDGFEISQGSLPNSHLSLPVEPIVMLWGQTSGMSVPPGTMGTVVSLAAGAAHCLALASDGEVTAWGENGHGESTVPSELPPAIAVDAGQLHSLALLEDGTVAAWGNNQVGQTDVPLGLTDVVAVSAGAFHNLALKGDGTLVAWGDDSEGQCEVPAGLSGVIAVAAGGFHSLALKSDGSVVAWGTDWEQISTVPGNLAGVVAIAAGGYHTLALKHDGTLVAWGWNDSGQCDIPIGLPAVDGISVGWQHNVARKADGSLVSWGRNSSGQADAPVEATHIQCFAAGWFHNIALRQTNGFPRFGDLSEFRSWPGESVSRAMPFLNASEITYSSMGLPAGLTMDPLTGQVTGTVLSGEKRAVRVSAETELGTFAEIVWFNTADGLPATQITLSSNLLMENSPEGTVIGTLSAIDPNLGDTHSFDLAYVPEGPDSFRFMVSGNQLLTRYALPLDFEAGPTITIRVIATDAGNNSFEQNFTLVLLDDRSEDADGDGVTEAMEEDVFGASDVVYTSFDSFDLDKDGVPGMVEYAFNMDPKAAGPPVRLVPGGGSTAGLPSITLVPAPGGGQRLRLEYIRRVGSILTYTPQFGTGLAAVNWQTAANPVQSFLIVPGWERCVVEDSQATSAASRRFGRVAVSW
jgi:alpha-tubulin suppressor-like RCC1 family protein